MRKYSVVLLATVAFMMIPATALAIPPEVIFEGEFEDSFDIPAGEVCAFEVHLHEVSRVKVTAFYNADGSLNHEKVMVRGRTVWSGPGGSASENWAWNGIFDPAALTFTQNGNVFNIHAGAGGVLVNDKGKIVIDVTTDEALLINGPHQAWFGEFDALCDAIA